MLHHFFNKQPKKHFNTIGNEDVGNNGRLVNLGQVASCNYSKTQSAIKGIFIKRCPENLQQGYRRKPMPKCDFNKIALQLY